MSGHPAKSGGPIFRPHIFPNLFTLTNLTKMHGCPFHDSALVVNLIYKESKSALM